MLKRILATLAGGPPTQAPTAVDHKLAAAVLLIEAATLDDHFDADERRTIGRVLKEHFAIDDAECATLIAAAEEAQGEANQLLRFTRAIKDNYAPENRIEIIEMLWEVAYADGVLHEYEANLLRRVGGLIYVSDRDRGAARLRVLDRLGITDIG
jgi:uncharacterized tellurite resistance protein B-like protein